MCLSLYINKELFTNSRWNENANECVSPIAGYHFSKAMRYKTILSTAWEWILWSTSMQTAMGIVSTKFTMATTSGKRGWWVMEGYKGFLNYICKIYFLQTKMYVSEAVEKHESMNPTCFWWKCTLLQSIRRVIW